MRFVAIKTKEQQAALVMHRARDLLVRQRTQLVNALRGLLAEFGISEPQGIRHVGRLRAHLDEDVVPQVGRDVLRLLIEQLSELEKQITAIEIKIRAWHRVNPVSQRLEKIPGVGPLIATAVVATVGDASLFRSGREFAAWLGLTPRQRSTGGKQRLGRITHQGDAYIRRLLIVGAQSALQCSKETKENAWIRGLLGRCARLKVAVALANKMARILWALMANGDTYRRASAA
jgi:transposase